MKTYPQHLRAFDRAMAKLVRAALKEHGSVRDAAASIEMPKSTLHDYAKRFGIEVPCS